MGPRIHPLGDSQVPYSFEPEPPFGGAQFSADGVYRYFLHRRWLSMGVDHGVVCFVMLNPSTADAEIDDPTVRRCVGFARRWGFSTLWVVNLFAARATDPRALPFLLDPVGPLNDEYLRRSTALAQLTVAAWGNAGALRDRGQAVKPLIGPARCFGLTKLGQPRHPLYVRYYVELQDFT